MQGIKVKICENPNCKDHYGGKNGWTKWKPDLFAALLADWYCRKRLFIQ